MDAFISGCEAIVQATQFQSTIVLPPIHTGICEGLTYNQIEQRYPKEFEARRVNKLFYRYPGTVPLFDPPLVTDSILILSPLTDKLCMTRFIIFPSGMGGESYLDVIQRLNPLIIELERMTSDLLIVTHRVVFRILLGYLMDVDRAKMPEMEVPLHTLYCVEPKPHGTVVRRFKWVEELDWFVEEPVTSE